VGVGLGVAVGVNEFGIAFGRSRSTSGWELARSISRVPVISKNAKAGASVTVEAAASV